MYKDTVTLNMVGFFLCTALWCHVHPYCMRAPSVSKELWRGG